MSRSCRIVLPSTLVLIALSMVGGARPSQSAGRGTITLTVDAVEAPRKIFHIHLVIPAEPGPLSLSYPKWIPGEHGPTGPVTDVAGLHISAEGESLPWERDLEDMYAVHFTVPALARSVQVDFDFISAASPEGFSSAASATERITLLSWNQVLLYPSGEPSDALTYTASLRLPTKRQTPSALHAR